MGVLDHINLDGTEYDIQDAGAYRKPQGGIPKTDLADGVKESLNKADNAAPQSTTYTKSETDTKLTTLLLGKQDVIQDLETIRSGAEKGATSVQPSDIVDSRGVFDLSAHNAVNGQLATYANLSAALVALNALELKYKYGGMSFKFVQTSDNKYVQFRYMLADVTDAKMKVAGNWSEIKDVEYLEAGINNINLLFSGNRKDAYFVDGYNQSHGLYNFKKGVTYTITITPDSSGTVYIALKAADGSNIKANNSYSTFPVSFSITPAQNYENAYFVFGSGAAKNFAVEVSANIYNEKEIDDLKTEVNTIEADVTELENDIDALEKAFSVTDIASTAPFTDKKYVKYSDAVIITAAASTNIGLYKIPNNNYIAIKINVGALDTIPAVIAFYSIESTRSDNAFDSTKCLGKIQAQAGDKIYTAKVPDGTKSILVTNAYGIVANPKIEVYTDFSSGLLEDKLIAQKNQEASSSSVYLNVNVSPYPIGTKFKVIVDSVSGSTEATINLLGTGEYKYCVIKNVSAGQYYIEKTEELFYIQPYKAAADGNVYNFRVYVVKSNVFPSGSNQIGNYLVSNFNSNPITLKNPFQGYYSGETWDEITYNDSWVSWPWEYSCGYKLKIQTDWEQYVVQVNKANLNTGFVMQTIQIDTIVDLRDVIFWSIQIRRINYANLRPQAAENLITVTVTEGSIKLRPADANTLSVLKKNVESLQSDSLRKKYVQSLFENYPCYYHFAANEFIIGSGGHNAIASESLEDVELAARLGFKFIEANVHITSDGKYVCIHGTNGMFGPECKSVNESTITTEALQATAINTKSLSWIKENVIYDSYYEKYQSTIPSLEEFCQACRKHGIGIFAGTNKRAAVEICVKYLGSNVIIYGPSNDIRDYFGGYVFTWNYGDDKTPETLIADARKYGAPYMCGMDKTLINRLIEDDELEGFVEDMHNENFLVGWGGVYASEEQGRLYTNYGLDFNGSGHDVNPFEPNYEIFDIDTENLPTTTGTISNGIITLANGDTITCGSSTKIIGKGWLSIKFNGTLTINFGSIGNYNRTIVSDGSENIVISDYFFMKGTSLTITAGAATTVTNFVYKTSKC